jgi:hypothetical protein
MRARKPAAVAPNSSLEFRVEQARVVVDGHMEKLPPDAAGPPAPVAMDAVAHAPDPAQLLHIEVHQLARVRALLALYGLRRR